MYITEAIERVKSLFPNEYSIEEMIMWCNQLSSDLNLNYNKKYNSLTICDQGEVLLPKGVDIYMIDRVIADGGEVKKKDVYDFAKANIYYEHSRAVIKKTENVGVLEIIYQEPYVPIRCISGVYSITNATDNSFFSDCNLIYVGDSLLIKKGDTSYGVCITGVKDGKYTCIGDALPCGDYEAEIERKIQEVTVCPPPYDYMYIDFLAAQIAFYQNNTNLYKNHMSCFTKKLDEYKKYIKFHQPIREKKLLNWF